MHASPGSYNNEIGLPLTLLARADGTEALVLEMGARFPGDIAALCAIARPRSAWSPTSGSPTPSTSAAATASPG